MVNDTSNTAEHLKLVQDIIARMAGNSVQMKTWAVSLVTATFIFSGLSGDPHWLIGVGGCIPVITFWTLDARYLHLERCYIQLYEEVVAGKIAKSFELDYRPYVNKVGSVWSVAWSWSVYRFYGALLLVVLVLLAILIGSMELKEA